MRQPIPSLANQQYTEDERTFLFSYLNERVEGHFEGNRMRVPTTASSDVTASGSYLHHLSWWWLGSNACYSNTGLLENTSQAEY
jgi:hypothetical protein